MPGADERGCGGDGKLKLKNKNMEKIGFSIMHLYEDSIEKGERFINPDFESFSKIENSFNILLDNIFYEINIEKNNNFVWFVFNYGKPNPIDENLTNINTGEKKENQRTAEEAELIQQLFVLYKIENSLLYISNLNKEKTFVKMITEKLDKNFHTHKFFKSRDEFIAILKDVDEISFTDARNLFNQDTKRRQALIDLTGTDAPEKFSLLTKYRKSSQLTDFITKLFKSRDKNELSELIIRGVDNDNFSFTYNIESFIQKITIQVAKNDNGLFEPESVKDELLKLL